MNKLVKNVLIALLFLLVVYIIVNMFIKPAKLTTMNDGNVEQTIKADKLRKSNSSTNYTYSMWFLSLIHI